MRSNRAFTLIELLVVIAIIAILAAIVFPVMTTAKARSSMVTCSNNLRQLTVAMTSYADDWQGRLPGLNALGDVVDGRYAYSQMGSPTVGKGPLWPYVRTKAVYVCPEDPLHRKTQDPNNSRSGGCNYTYTMNSYMTMASVNRRLADICGVLTSKSMSPSKTILLVDENTDPGKNASVVNDLHFASGDRTGDRHPGGDRRTLRSGMVPQGVATVSYLDGHTGSVPGLVRWDDEEGKVLFWR